jgi:hypothetical protein
MSKLKKAINDVVAAMTNFIIPFASDCSKRKARFMQNSKFTSGRELLTYLNDSFKFKRGMRINIYNVEDCTNKCVVLIKGQAKLLNKKLLKITDL